MGEKDGGIYKIVAENSAGKETHEFKLQIQSKPTSVDTKLAFVRPLEDLTVNDGF